MRKSILKTAGIIAIALFGLASCSSDDSNNGPGGGGSIDAAVGTFKGTITITNGPNSGNDIFNATIIVTKASNNKLTITPKSGESYSNLTPKTIQVYNNTQGILNDGNTPEGNFIFALSSKTLTVQTKEQLATDAIYTFDGTKQ